MQSDNFYDCEADLPYRDPTEIEGFELSEALRSLKFPGDDSYLNMQVFNPSVVDQFIMCLEYDRLRKLHEEESTPAEAMFLSAQSQMWIFAAHELLRTWKERSGEIIKLHQSGSLHPASIPHAWIMCASPGQSIPRVARGDRYARAPARPI